MDCLNLCLSFYKCKTWNFPEERRCARCGFKNPSYASANDHRHRDGFYDDHRHFQYSSSDSVVRERQSPPKFRGCEDTAEGYFARGSQFPSNFRTDESKDRDKVDEFGRTKSKSPGRTKAPMEWPPKFEDFGFAYTFDNRSGMFYEANSDFFYDPNSKLYFGNRKSAYYRFNAAFTPPFEEVQKVEAAKHGASNEVPGDPEPILATNCSKSASSRPSSSDSSKLSASIAIKLKTKSFNPKKRKKAEVSNKSATDAADDALAATSATRLAKKHSEDIQKWSERRQELKDEDTTSTDLMIKTAGEPATDVEQKVDQQLAAVHLGKEVAKTAKGEPICTLCRRKFPSLEKLRFHEKVSQLHKENLAKQQRELKSKSIVNHSAIHSNGVTSAYVDRAQQRRDMYGTDVTSSVVLPMMDVDLPREDLGSETGQQAQTPGSNPLSESNVGRKMLEKLGWANESSSKSGTSQQLVSLKKEWDRMENVAAATSQGGRQGA